MCRLKTNAYLLLLVILTLISCKEEQPLFYTFSPVPPLWTKSEQAVIALPDSLASGEYPWDIEVRNLAFYPYRDLWLSMEIESQKEGNTSVSSQTLHFYLTDSTSHWNYEGTIGTHFISTFPQETKFTVADSTYHYKVRFRHLMKDERLRGISDIGIKLKRK